MSDSNTEAHLDQRTFAEYLSMTEPTAIVSLEILEALENTQLLKDKNIETIASLSQGELATFIARELPGNIRSANKIARELIKLFAQDGIRQSQRVESNGNSPIPEVVVKFPENPQLMSLKQLMVAISEDPSYGSEYLPLIEKKENVQAALNKSLRPLVLVHGKLDIDASIDRINHLAQPYTREQRPDRGIAQKFVSLKQGLGIYQPVYIHPLDGKPISGKDEAGYDYSLLDEDIAKSLIWATKSKHPLLPADLNKATVGAILFGERLDTPFNLILQDYWNALDAKDPTALNLSFELNEAEAKQKTASSRLDPIPDQKTNWQNIVQTNARKSAQILGSNQDVKGIFKTISVLGSSVNLDNIVVISRATLVGSNIVGTIIVPSLAVKIESIGLNNEVMVIQKSWEEIARLYQLV